MRGTLRVFLGLVLLMGAAHSWIREAEDAQVVVKLNKPYGSIKGVFRKTKVSENPYRVFRNIPYADPITSKTRFKQSKSIPADNELLGTDEKPYDATRTGPLCPQGGTDPKEITKYLNKTLKEIVKELLTKKEVDKKVMGSNPDEENGESNGEGPDDEDGSPEGGEDDGAGSEDGGADGENPDGGGEDGGTDGDNPDGGGEDGGTDGENPDGGGEDGGTDGENPDGGGEDGGTDGENPDGGGEDGGTDGENPDGGGEDGGTDGEDPDGGGEDGGTDGEDPDGGGEDGGSDGEDPDGGGEDGGTDGGDPDGGGEDGGDPEVDPLKVDAILAVFMDLFDIKGDINTMTLGDTLRDVLDIDYSISEDCLHLSVSTPSAINPVKFPVMVFIHGGSFTSGTHLHNEADRLGDVSQVVVVSINYRLGVQGFLCLDTEESAGNQGMLDIVLALEWVQKYIGEFGGDKDRVTIFGESAGSAAVGHLILSPLVTKKKLFKNAIGQSGSPIASWAFDRNPQESAIGFAKEMNCTTNEGHDSIVECLRKFESWDLSKKYLNYLKQERGKEISLGFTAPCAQTKGPIMFYESNDDPREILSTGKYFKDVNILAGSNLNEGSAAFDNIYEDFLKPNKYDVERPESKKYFRDHLISDLNRAFGIQKGYTIENLIAKDYFGEKFDKLETVLPGFLDYAGVQTIKASSYEMVKLHSRDNGTAYYYSYEYQGRKSFCSQKLKEMDSKIGACHADELFLLFDYEFPLMSCQAKDLLGKYDAYETECKKANPDPSKVTKCLSDLYKKNDGDCIFGALSEEDKKVGEKMLKAWVNFAYNGDPNGDGLPPLHPWNVTNPEYIIFDKKANVSSDYTDKFIVHGQE